MVKMKSLNGSELAGYIKERQAKQVRALRQAHGIFPKLAIIQTIDNPVTETYLRLKRTYGEDLLIDVDVHNVSQSEALNAIKQLNQDPTVHGIIIQLPMANPTDTQACVDAVSGKKDVDGLGKDAVYEPATPLAIDWLLVGYGIELQDARIAIVGQGRLVGAPLSRLWQARGYDVVTVDVTTPDIGAVVNTADVVVTATGTPGLITSDMLRPHAVIVDAGTASENGKIVGDVARDVRLRDDVTITPEKGGVGPLTVTALFDNLIRAAQAETTASAQL